MTLKSIQVSPHCISTKWVSNKTLSEYVDLNTFQCISDFQCNVTHSNDMHFNIISNVISYY